MDWIEIGRNNLEAAKRMMTIEPRTATSRAYYAAHAVLAHVLVNAGYVCPPGRQTPPHAAQSRLIERHLGKLGRRGIREARATLTRLHSRRIDADYRRNVTIDQAVSRQAVRDAASLMTLLEAR